MDFHRAVTADREVTNQTVGRSCRSDDRELKTQTTEPHFFQLLKVFNKRGFTLKLQIWIPGNNNVRCPGPGWQRGF